MLLGALLLLGGNGLITASERTVESYLAASTPIIVALVGALLFSPRPERVAAGLSTASLVGLAYLAVVGSLAFLAYTYLLTREPAERLVSYALVNPLIAVVLGISFGGERTTPLFALGLPLVLLGLGVMLYGERLRDALRGRLLDRR